MRQIMRSMVALMVLVSSAVPASAAVAGGFEADDSVKVEQVNVRTITGTVYDAATNTPLPGVRVQGTGHQNITTMTDGEGKYKLNVPSYVTLLTYSTPEFGMVQRPILKDDVINVRLYSDKFVATYSDDIKLTAGDEFTVGTTTALSIDGDIQSNLGAHVRSITRSGTPGIGAFMLIRGINTLNANSQPLVIVDDIILDMQEDYGSLHMGMFNNVLSAIDVNDIDNVEVLSNGTAIYGARAANGVIKITTKRGKSMATRITANIYAGVALTPKVSDMMKAEQFRSYANEMIGTMGTKKTDFPFLRADKDYYYYNKYHNETDWADEVYREALTQNYKVNVEGGDDIAMYNFSLGYTMGESTLDKNTFDRLNIRFNSDLSITKNLKTRFDISYSRVARELLDDGIMENSDVYPYSSPGFLAMIKAPFLSPYMYSQTGVKTSTLDIADDFAWGIDEKLARGQDNNSYYNPLTIINVGSGENKNDQEYTHFSLTVAPELKLGDFRISETFNYSLHRMNEKYYLPYATDASALDKQFYAANMGRIGNFISSSFGKETAITSDTRVAWSKILGANSIDVVGGFRYTRFAFDSNFLSCANSGNDKATNISADYDYLSDDGDDNVWTNLAWYLKADYSLYTRYFLEAALSVETSSRFGKEADGGLSMGGVKWGVFPSLQAAWLLSSESWFNVRPINSLKLRAGFDMTGNDAIDFYAARSFMQAVKFQDKYMGVQLGNVENDGVKWETTSRFNVGIDGLFFDNRLAVSFDWYKSVTKDLVVPKVYEFVAGMDTYWGNGGELENTGFEASVTAKLVNTRNFQWELGLSAGHYKNEVTALDEDIAPVSVYGGEVLTKVGESVGVFYGYKTDGVISSDAEAKELGLYQKDATGKNEYFAAGDVKFVDMTGEGEISAADKVIIGNPNPDLFGNIFTRVALGNWTLNVGLNYSLGNDVYNYYRSQLEGGKNFFNQTTAMLNRWTVDGDKTDMPRAVYGDPMGNSRFSDRWIEDGSYLRLKTVQLSYNVPVSLNWLQGITVWCAAENLLTLTKYLGNDPEFSVNNNILYQGVDAGLLPQSRSFHLGVKVNL